MASINRGQPPAWHTKGVHHGSAWVLKGRLEWVGFDDGIPSKPGVMGMGMADVQMSFSKVT